MQEFVPGQRWISDTELQNGLGTVLKTDHRSVSVVFISTGETRTYAKETAPLSRARFAKDDVIRSHEGWSLTVQSVEEVNGLLTYHGIRDNGTSASLHEGELDNFIQLNKPSDRLLTGQIDPDKWFELRYQTLLHVNSQLHSDVRGLAGGRTDLIPHQLYIAHEVANRYAPRVLLADEVGLGKTIEAGLILHQQLVTERAQRVLIVVPESLLHQWLVEMLRRFNLRFSIFDEERCLAEEETANQDNPFFTEQLVLCSLGFLSKFPNRFQQALAGSWDLLVVDEAHHLQWQPNQPSTEYLLVEQLSKQTKGVLLLTATPEQLGKESHFARLRLLDQDRFDNYEAFVEEEQSYQPVADAVDELLGGNKLSERAYRTLVNTIEEGDNYELLEQLASTDRNITDNARQQLVDHLLDRHGTGRVLFRNTRSAIKGFPDRQVHAYPLPLPDEYAECLTEFQSSGVIHPQELLSPELLYQSQRSGTPLWTQIDPRIDWLTNRLRQLKPDKVLVIAANARSVLDIAEALRVTQGIHAAVFHEGLSIVERDRAAAFFAEPESGSQILICSEIGSEGRNFQFVRHLILFDLPYNPDLLEQRIGRLDRIGQKHTIQIHVPYLDNSPQMVMFQWYHEGLAAFEHTCPAGQSVFTRLETELIETLHQFEESIEDLPALIETTRRLNVELNTQLQQGRDRLLEYNSCRPAIAENLIDKIHHQDNDDTLPAYLDAIFDGFGIDTEIHSKASYVVHPGPHTDLASFPLLQEDGTTITFDRETALANENMQFITWEHPLVSGAIDLILSNEQGNTALCAIKHPNINPGTLMVEAVYVLESAAREQLQVGRYLPPTTLRIVTDGDGKSYEQLLTHDSVRQYLNPVNVETAVKVVKTHRTEIKTLIDNSERIASQRTAAILAEAQQRAYRMLHHEINRLRALQRVNPNVRQEEIDFFQEQQEATTQVLETAAPRLNAIRIIIAT
ncbi:MAG: RNA polymerase-associated protein RapA [Gammaproteobacteria bacterium]